MPEKRIAAVVPVYNPEPGLKALCEALLARYELVIVVDDGSCEHVEDFALLPEGIRLLRHPVNRGKGRAIKTAIAWLRKHASSVEVAVFADGDGQHRPEDVSAVAALALETKRVVLGVRDFTRAGIPFRSRFGNVLTSFLVRKIYRFPIEDTQTGLRAIPSRLFGMMLTTVGERYEYEMRLFGRLSELQEPLEQVPIETIYISNNRASHFHPVRDSIRVYRGLFGGRFFRFLLSSLGGFVIDNVLFSLLMLAVGGLALTTGSRILIALLIARCCSSFVNYQCNRLLVFGSKLQQSVSLWRYTLLVVVVMLLSWGGTSLLTYLCHADGLWVTSLKILVEVALFLVSYRIQKVWVFQSSGETEFNAMQFSKRLLSMFGPLLPFAVLLPVDVSVVLASKGWALNLPTFVYALRCAAVSLFPILALPLVFRRFARFVMPMLFTWMLFVDGLEIWMFNAYDLTVRGELLSRLMGSSWEEIVAFLGTFVTWRFFAVAVALLAASVVGIRLLWRNPGAYPRRAVFSYLLAALLMLLGLKLGYSAKKTAASYVVINAVEQYGRYRNLTRAVEHPELEDVISPEHHVPVAIFAFGESATRDHWQLYGYPYETTPELMLRRNELVVFNDLLASWAHVQTAMQLLTTRATLDQPDAVQATMPQILSHAGYRCVLLSNQSRWASRSSVATLLFAGCEEIIHLNELDPVEANEDDRLIHLVERELAQTEDKRPVVIFLHLRGSLSPFQCRCPEDTAFFSAPGEIDPAHAENPNAVEYYDDTIRNTDRVLAGLLQCLDRRGGESLFVHLSTVGETPDAETLRAQQDPSLWRIPFFVWCSPGYRAAYPERMRELSRVKGLPHQSDRLFDGLLELVNVKLEAREDESFLSPDYDRTLPRRIEDGSRSVGPRW